MNNKIIYPDINYKQVTELDLLMAPLIFPILVEIAPTGKTLTYIEVVELVKARYPDMPEVSTLHHRLVGRRLGVIWRFTEQYGYPHIGSIVVNKSTGECGRGVTEILDPVKERIKVRDFDWSNIELYFNSYLSKTKEAQKTKSKKLVKRKYDEAKTIFFDYWALVKGESALKEIELSKSRKELISIVESGHAPATALSNILLNLLKKQECKNLPDSGYVYIGEYQNVTNDEPLFDLVKIGFTERSVKDRESALSGGVIGPLKFVVNTAWKFEKGFAFPVEQELHGFLDDYRQMGEFFINNDGLIEDLATQFISKKYHYESEPVVINGELLIDE